MPGEGENDGGNERRQDLVEQVVNNDVQGNHMWNHM